MSLSTSIVAQKGSLNISHPKKEKGRVIKENKRIQIKTYSGMKVRGRFAIVDENTLMIKDELYSLSDIALIRRSPQFDAVMTIVNMVWIGGWSLVGGVTGVIPLYVALPISAGTTYALFDPPNLNKGYRVGRNWSFSLKTAQDK